MSKILKIWGERNRVLENDLCEIDILNLKAHTACSIHRHKFKNNRFILLKGKVYLKTDLGIKHLKLFEPFDVEPPLIHQFVAKEDSILLEIAFVKKGKINLNDIERFKQGGILTDSGFKTLDELKEKVW